MPPIEHRSLLAVPERKAAQSLLILPQTPFTLTTGLAKCRKPISDGSLAHRRGQPEQAEPPRAKRFSHRPRFLKKNRLDEVSNLRNADQARVEPPRAERSSQKAKETFKQKERY